MFRLLKAFELPQDSALPDGNEEEIILSDLEIKELFFELCL